MSAVTYCATTPWGPIATLLFQSNFLNKQGISEAVALLKTNVHDKVRCFEGDAEFVLMCSSLQGKLSPTDVISSKLFQSIVAGSTGFLTDKKVAGVVDATLKDACSQFRVGEIGDVDSEKIREWYASAVVVLLAPEQIAAFSSAPKQGSEAITKERGEIGKAMFAMGQAGTLTGEHLTEMMSAWKVMVESTENCNRAEFDLLARYVSLCAKTENRGKLMTDISTQISTGVDQICNKEM
jgi:hypothetical protein